MPELPEVEVTLRALAPELIGRTIDAVTIREPRLRWPIPKTLPTLLAHQKILHCERRGKYILLHMAKGTLLLHLGMSGRLAWLPANSVVRKHDHVDIHFTHQKILRFHDPRRFGAILWTTTPTTHPLLASLGIEPLSDTFCGNFLYESTRRRQSPIKTFMMNAQHVVGVGNIYANEALFLARISPHRSAHHLTLKECTVLVECIKTVLQIAITQGGSSLRDFVSADGRRGYFQQTLRVYGRANQPCSVCDTRLIDTRLGNRQTVYCLHCQI